MKRIAITGASGFVGRHLCPWLKRSGYDIIAISTTPEPPPRLLRYVDRWLYVAELDQAADFRGRLRGVDAVVHLAALVHQTSEQSYADYHRVNVTGTEAVIRSAISEGVRRFIHISSVKVNGEATISGKPFDAQSEPAPAGPYALSKLRAEEHVAQSGELRAIETVILRPVLTYGPYVGANFLRLLNLVKRRWPLPFGGIRNARSLLYVDNFCDLIQTCIEHENAPGHTFFAADGCAISTPDLVREIAAALNIEPWLFSFPEGLMRPVARALGQNDSIGRLFDSLEVSLKSNAEYLGWTPKISTRAGIRRTVDALECP